ncbi:MAG: hypothetical protein AB4911_18730 [Oscillochloridaceae bacterium umkhey_bin13]
MTDRESYSDEEWATILAAPVAVIAAVIGISPGGPMAIMQEVGAAVKSFERAAEERRDNPLIVAMLVSLKGRFDAFHGGQGDPANEQVQIMDLGRDPAVAVAACRAARDLLEQKAPGPEGLELRTWLIDLASDVAHAAKEGGFLGMGGELVNAKERAMLHDLADALGVTAPDLP